MTAGKEGTRGHDIWAQAPATFKVTGSPRKSISRLGRTPKTPLPQLFLMDMFYESII